MRIVTYIALILLLPLTVLVPQQGKAQSLLGVGAPGIIGMPDTVTMGDTVDFSYWLVNRSPVPFPGPALTNLMVNGIPVASPISSNSIPVINPYDSVMVLISGYIFTPAQHGGGGNVMVIWPTGTNGTPSDSAEKEVFVNEPVAIDGPEPGYQVSIYPNPVHHNLQLEGWPPGDPLEILTVMELNGKAIREFDLRASGSTSIDLSEIPTGIYFVNMKFQSGKTQTHKVIKH